MTISYDLASEGWIPVRMRDGALRRVGLREALVEAQDIASLDMNVPLEELGVFRVLMAIAYRAVNGPRKREDRIALYERGSFPADRVNGYFVKHGDRFDLFGERYPFLQTPGLCVLDSEGRESPLPIETICFECINNKTLFEHHGEANPRVLDPAETARKMIAFQYYALSGMAKKRINIDTIGYQPNFFNAPFVSGLLTILLGPTLFDTLCLNMIVVNGNQPIAETDHEQNVPPWEREALLCAGRETPAGYFDFLVPISRHMRLVPENIDDRVFVRSLHLTQGQKYTNIFDPMFSFKKDFNNPSLIRPTRLNADRALWRESSCLFAYSRKSSGDDLRCQAFKEFGPLRGIYTKRSGKVIVRCRSFGLVNEKAKANPVLWRSESLEFPQSLLEDYGLTDCVVAGLKKAEGVGADLKEASRIFAQIALGKDPAATDVKKFMETIGVIPVYWSSLEVPFRRFLAEIDSPESEVSWRDAIARAAFDAFGRCVDARSLASSTRYKAIVEAERYLRSVVREQLGKKDKEVVDGQH